MLAAFPILLLLCVAWFLIRESAPAPTAAPAPRAARGSVRQNAAIEALRVELELYR